MLNIFSKAVLATKAECSVILPRVLYLRGEDKQGLTKVVKELTTISVVNLLYFSIRLVWLLTFLQTDTDLSFSFNWTDEYRQIFTKYTLEQFNEVKPATPQYLSGIQRVKRGVLCLLVLISTIFQCRFKFSCSSATSPVISTCTQSLWAAQSLVHKQKQKTTSIPPSLPSKLSTRVLDLPNKVDFIFLVFFLPLLCWIIC